MEKTKKKMICLLIMVMIFSIGVIFVSAEEEVENDSLNMNFPKARFGMSAEDFMKANSFSNGEGQAVNPQVKTKTLSNGSSETELFYIGTSDSGIAADYMYYFLDDQMAALVVDFLIPEGFTFDMIRDGLIAVYGVPVKLNLEDLGLIPEMIGERAQLEDGQEGWNYMAYVGTPVVYSDEDMTESSGQELNMTVMATGTVKELGDHILITVFTVASSTERSAEEWTVKLSDLQNINDLTKEEQQKVSEYMDYLEYQMRTQAQDYISYIRQQHQD